MQDKIALIGATTLNDSKAFLEDGSIDVATLWDPEKLGYLTVYLAKLKLEKKEITDGMEIPNVGKIKVETDGKTVIMGTSIDYTKENISNYGS